MLKITQERKRNRGWKRWAELLESALAREGTAPPLAGVGGRRREGGCGARSL